MREGGGNCLKYLKRWWNRKEGKGNKDFKKEGGQGVGALKRGAGTPLRTMNKCLVSKLIMNKLLLTKNKNDSHCLDFSNSFLCFILFLILYTELRLTNHLDYPSNVEH